MRSISFDSPLGIADRSDARKPPVRRLLAIRESTDKSMIFLHRGCWLRTIETAVARDAGRGSLVKVLGETIVVTEIPHTPQTVGVSACLAITVVDSQRLAGAAIHILNATEYEEPLAFALAILNSPSRNLLFGLSGITCGFSGDEADARAWVAAKIGRLGRIIYNQLGKKGDIAISFTKRMIYPPDNLSLAVRY